MGAGPDDTRSAGERTDGAALPHALPSAERAEAILRDACITYRDDSPMRRRRAQRLLDADPSLAAENVYTAAVTANVAALRKAIAADPGCVSQPGGPNDWQPLLYLCYGRLPKIDGDTLEAARVLLDAGADPNACLKIHGVYSFTALTGAMGEGEAGLENQPPHPRARELAELLLDRGADPNDSQGLYNTHFTPGNEWIELMISRGLTTDDMPNWVPEEKQTRSMLDWMLGVSVTWGFAERVALLLDHGADPNGTNAYDDRPHYENALLFGRPEIAKLLLERGATRIELSPASAFRAVCMTGDERAARAQLEQDPTLIDDPRMIHDTVKHGSDAAGLLIFELGASLDAPGQHYSETPLHRAAIEGRAAVVDKLLALGAHLDGRDTQFHGTPVGWANAGGHEAIRERILDRSEDVFDLATFGRVEQLRELLAKDGLQATRTSEGGATAMHMLRVAGEPGAAVIDLLCDHGADVNAPMEDGTTPLAAALARDEVVVAELLRARGAV